MKEENKIISNIDNFYRIISGKKNEKREWQEFLNLFTNDAIIKSIKNNKSNYNYIKINNYIKQLSTFLENNDFYEYGFNYSIHIFEDIANVISEYEAKNNKEDKNILKSGFNYINLYKENNNWKISSMLWQDTK